jgi:hypothetical protein
MYIWIYLRGCMDYAWVYVWVMYGICMGFNTPYVNFSLAQGHELKSMQYKVNILDSIIIFCLKPI